MKNFLSEFLKRINPKTSLSDNGRYPSFCLEASRDPSVFVNFRRNEIYNEILEHVTDQEALVYISEIKRQSNRLENIELFKENDLYGNPIKKNYPDIGEISPTTLRYVKVLTDLEVMLGNLNNLKIIEIGVGYGGQCRIINSIFNPASYTLVDLKPALELTKAYLNNFKTKSPLIYKTMDDLQPETYDLVISNYAFTELPKKIQDIYLKKVILKSKNGYITYNDINPPEFDSYKKEKLIGIISNSKISAEVPLTSEKNCIITW